MLKFLRNPVILTFISGLTTGYAILHGTFILAWICLVPLFVALHQKSLKQSVMLGMVFGFASYLNCLWIITLTSTFTGSGIGIGLMVMLICTLVTVLYRALMMLGLFFINSAKSNALIVNALNIASAWVMMEMAWNLPLSGLPWLQYYSGDTLLGNFYAIQPASYFGVHILTFAVIFSNYLFASLLLQKNWTKLCLPVLFILFYVLAGWASVKLFDNKLTSSEKPFKMAILSDNIPPETKWDDRSGNLIVENILDLNRRALALKPNIILWSESAIPWTYKPDDDLLKEIHRITASGGITHLIGMNTVFSGNMLFNSLYCILPDGRVSGRYDKSTSLDFVEGKIGGILIPFFSDNGFYVKKGNDPKPLDTPFGKAGVMICNESFLSKSAVNMARKGAEFLVNSSNDGWFRETAVVGLHFNNARLRAVETRKDMVVNSNNGYCGVIESSGRIVLKEKENVSFLEMVRVTPNKECSFFTSYPNLFIYLCIAYLFCFLSYRLYVQKLKNNNKMKVNFILILLLLEISCFSQKKDLVHYVNTLQGTNSSYALSNGNTYATTALPFGMHTWSPQTGKNGDGWKYTYDAKTIRGFQQAHQCSPWVNDYAVFSLMPEIGTLKVNENERALSFSHNNEIAKPNYYKVTFDNKIITEIAPTERGTHLRFTFPSKEKSYVVLDGYTRMSKVEIIPSERKIVGYVNNGRFIPENFRNYFVIVFDKPFKAYGTWENVKNEIFENKLTAEGKGIGAYIQFNQGEKVQAKVASSYISLEQAEVTLNQELGKYSKLEQTKAAGAEVWNKLFNRVLVEGGTEEEMATFYSCLFRANLFSRQFFEYKKNSEPYYYSPYDGKVHDGYMFTDNGFWDTFRGQFPLNTIIHPTYEGRYMNALLDAQSQCGWLPAWSFPGETGGMLGNHAISLLTDAWVKGIRTFDPKRAVEAYFHEATNKGPWGGANGRAGWKDYYQLGYVAYPGSEGALSQTLEYAYDDFCGYQLAQMTGQHFYANRFAKQMYNYKNLYDSTSNFMRGRLANGEWVPNFDPYSWGGPYTEGNAWHWQWSVFHDVQGLINIMGGNAKFIAILDSVFTVPNKVNVGAYGQTIHEMTEMVNANMGQYAQGNEPIQHMIYLYNYAGQPWKAQKNIREVMGKLYNATENGYPGDEDQGQMSSWYVLSALGFYSVCPGTDQYVIGSPVFRKATITMEDGKKFVIEARNNSKNDVYIQSATLNGKIYSKNWLSHSDIVNGGTLIFEMGDKPALNRGLSNEDKPFSLTRP